MPDISKSKRAGPDPGSTARTDALLEDICSLTGMPFPNLLYRVLAEHPDTLEDCWSRVRAGLADVGAGRLRDLISFVDPVNTDRSDMLNVLDERQRRILLAVLDVYDSGNCCNGVISVLLLRGSGGRASATAAREVSAPTALQVPSIPPMVDLVALSESARMQAFRLARIGDPQGQVVPSLFRHLAEDEALLGIIADRLELAVADGEFDRVHRQVQGLIESAADQWPEQVHPLSDPGTRDLIRPFARAIPRMIAVSVLLRRGL